MPISNTTATNTLRLAVITCFAHNGYRRAGIGFCKGENKFNADDFSESQLEQLNGDPRLKLIFIEPDAVQTTILPDSSSGQTVDLQANKTRSKEGPTLSGDLGATFADAVAKLEPDNKAHFTGSGKPQCEALSELMGKPVSASERDLWWTEFQAANVTQQSEQ
ncbi:HI1506-related protein [Shewanella woodyi]|uniref:HI1506-related protein n=1 Tax=Shewanella woodyi TaxID=60961 RepID=UPI0007F94D3C|nr:HI1506-related protein [Shewanella woodyi]